MSGLIFLRGDPAARESLAPALGAIAAGGDSHLELLREKPGRRRLLRTSLPDGRGCFVKHFLPTGGRHRVREWLKRRLGLATELREWRALERLHRAGVAVPEPLALVALPDGGRLLAMRELAGRPLTHALAAAPAARRRLVVSVGRLVAALHAAGMTHRDLHRENVFVTDEGPVLVDLQLALPSRRRAARLRDVGELDRSLADHLSLADRVRLRAAALGLERPFGPRERSALRAAGHAAQRRAHAHFRSRTRRALRPGRLYAPVELEGDRGLCTRGVAEASLRAALARRDGGQRAAVPTGDGPLRALHWGSGGLRCLADAFRGSPARRAWRAGHGLRARGIAAARPRAFAERRRLGVPVASWLVVEAIEPRHSPEAWLAHGDAAALARAVSGLAIALHWGDVRWRRLALDRLAVDDSRPAPTLRPAELDGVSFPRRLAEARRIEDLAALNAALPETLSDGLRRAGFDRYALAVPFAQPPSSALRRVVERSRRRAERWSGTGCRAAR